MRSSSRQRAGDLDVQFAHLGEGALEALRDGALGEAQAGELGDVLGHVAHALQRSAHPERGHHDAQVARDRLLTGEDLDGLLVEGDGEGVDVGVVGDDLFGQRDIARRERAGRLVDRDRDEVRDLHELGLQIFEGLMEDFAHGGATFRSCLDGRHPVERTG